MKKKQAPKPRYIPQERYGYSGGGKHEDRRTKRNRARATQKRQAMKEWE